MCKDSTLGRICKSAPTVFLNSMAQAVGFVQTQRVRGGYCKFGGAERVNLCEDSTLGRICKSAPTVFLNSMARAVGFVQTQRVRGGYCKFGGASGWGCADATRQG